MPDQKALEDNVAIDVPPTDAEDAKNNPENLPENNPADAEPSSPTKRADAETGTGKTMSSADKGAEGADKAGGKGGKVVKKPADSKKKVVVNKKTMSRWEEKIFNMHPDERPREWELTFQIRNFENVLWNTGVPFFLHCLTSG